MNKMKEPEVKIYGALLFCLAVFSVLLLTVMTAPYWSPGDGDGDPDGALLWLSFGRATSALEIACIPWDCAWPGPKPRKPSGAGAGVAGDVGGSAGNGGGGGADKL